MSSAQDLRERMVAAGAVRAGEADPVADQPPPLAMVVQPETRTKKTTSRFTGELPFALADLLVDIANEATRRVREPAIRHIDVVRRVLEHLQVDPEARERLVSDLVTNPPKRSAAKGG